MQAKDMRASGDVQGALEKYKGAWANAPTPIIGVEMGRTHMQLGQLIEAREAFLAVGRLKVEPDETPRSAQARAEASELAEQLRPKIGTLVLRVKTAPGATPTVAIDGANVALVSSGATRKINPGKHEIVTRVGATEKHDSVDIAEGETKELAVDVSAPAEQTPVAPPPTTPTTTTDTSNDALRPVLIYGGFGLAGAGVLVGGVTGIMAFGKGRTVKNECPAKVCPESARNDVNTGRTLATISTISIGAAVVGAAAGVVGLFVLRPKDADKPAPVAPSAAFISGGAILGARGEF